MSFLCKVGLHQWQTDPFSDRRRVCARCFESRPTRLLCHYGLHQWEGRCKCSSCDAQRDAGHPWKGCLCRACGKKRDEQHEWKGCLCNACRKTRDEQHDWQDCVCKRCGHSRDQDHRWRGCQCVQCHKTRDVEHRWGEFSCAVCQKERYARSKDAILTSREHVFETGVVSACVKAGAVEELVGGPGAKELEGMPIEEVLKVGRTKERVAVYLACREFGCGQAEAERMMRKANAYTVAERAASSVTYAQKWGDAPVYYVQIMERYFAEVAREITRA